MTIFILDDLGSLGFWYGDFGEQEFDELFPHFRPKSNLKILDDWF